MTTSKLPSLIDIRSILKGWFSKVSIVMGGIFSIEARDMDTKLLSAPESNSTLARCNGQINITVADYFQWNGPLFLAVLDQMATYILLFSVGVVASPEGFLSSVLLWLVIIVAVVGVGVTIVVVIIVAVVVVVESSSVVKLSFVITWILASKCTLLMIH
ncbi:hypothetical protein Tco_0265139 [Tanacetum coccineum]